MRKVQVITMKFNDWLTEPNEHRWYFKTEEYSWIEYVVETNPRKRKKIRRWSKENLIGRHDVDNVISFFALEEDAVHYALRWA